MLPASVKSVAYHRLATASAVVMGLVAVSIVALAVLQLTGKFSKQYSFDTKKSIQTATLSLGGAGIAFLVAMTLFTRLAEKQEDS